MLVSASRKNKVVLADYNFRRDIENRILLAKLSVFDVEVLNEVLSSSLSLLVSDLCEVLGASHDLVVESLDKLTLTKLLQHDKVTIRVDKELRKYYEFQIQKFDDDFAPDLEYIFRGLKRIPIPVLPNWYSIPRSTDHIFDSIIEKYMMTPKVYGRHLLDLSFDDEIPHAIMEEVFAAEDFKVRSKALRDKYNLSREQFEEYMLLLEFNFVCYLSYRRINDQWKEVVTPMHEWREYLRFQRTTISPTLPEAKVNLFHSGGHYAFISDLVCLTRVLQQQPLQLDGTSLPGKTLNMWNSSLVAAPDEMVIYANQLLNKIVRLGVAEICDGHVVATAQAGVWTKKLPQDQAMALYRLSIQSEDFPKVQAQMLTEKNLRGIEKALKRVSNSGWVTLDDFIKGMSEPLGDAEPVTLRQKGKRWSFVIPTYSEADRALIHAIIFHRLFQVGMVSIGTYEDKPCFAVTPFGKASLGE